MRRRVFSVYEWVLTKSESEKEKEKEKERRRNRDKEDAEKDRREKFVRISFVLLCESVLIEFLLFHQLFMTDKCSLRSRKS